MLKEQKLNENIIAHWYNLARPSYADLHVFTFHIDTQEQHW